ncbi:probable serine/threonine-protein kinase kinX isoform X2 [Daphnia magna]|uniref:probable serine/threonine-protein kinase kinX isoform X2 n=1 Tax=Daphnia magna TaxID=35525 RepID=UPI0006DDF8B7|nr:probable serine/threonine-protein kinase kinX isoform X2 [Daphnia magna]
MTQIKTLGLLIIIVCAILHTTNTSPLVEREDDVDGEETDREFEDAFEEKYNEEVARSFQEEKVDDAREFEEEVRELQDQLSPYDKREEESAGEVTDREFEDAFDEAVKEEMVRDFQEENIEEAVRALREYQDQQSTYDAKEDDATGEETDREFENIFEKAVKEEMSRNFEEENVGETRNFEGEDEVDFTYQQDEERSENERQITADFDVTPPKKESQQEEEGSENERQITADLNVTPPKKESEVKKSRPRSTQPLRLSKLIIRPVLTKRCQGEKKFSQSHCAKYLACGKTMFRGAVRTCESGQLFDATLQQCRDSSKVDCTIY